MGDEAHGVMVRHSLKDLIWVSMTRLSSLFAGAWRPLLSVCGASSHPGLRAAFLTASSLFSFIPNVARKKACRRVPVYRRRQADAISGISACHPPLPFRLSHRFETIAYGLHDPDGKLRG